MRVQCLLSFSNVCKLLGLYVLATPSPARIDRETATALLISIAICGLVMTRLHGAEIMQYCNVGPQRLMVSDVLHVLLPGLLIWAMAQQQSVPAYSFVRQVASVCVIGGLYLWLASLNITSTYGMDWGTLIRYALACLILTFMVLWAFKSRILS